MQTSAIITLGAFGVILIVGGIFLHFYTRNKQWGGKKIKDPMKEMIKKPSY